MLIDSFKPRLYQQTILNTASKKNTLVVIPTGLGKTAIAAMLAAQRLTNYPNSKILFLAPTKPLVQQHIQTFKSMFKLEEEKFSLFTGAVAPAKRAKLWSDSTFIFSTPQGLENDLISNKISLSDVSLLIFDEAHRATGEYAYVFIAQQYQKTSLHERILALTASPGSDEQSILDICQNLFVDDIEVRSYDDPDIKPYTQELDISWINVELDDTTKKIQSYLLQSYNSKLAEANTLGVLHGKPQNYTKSSLLSLQGALMGRLAGGEKTFEVLKTVSLIAESLKLQHALELCETQNYLSLQKYIAQLRSQALTSKTKAVKNLVNDAYFKSAAILVDSSIENNLEHPKLRALENLVLKQKEKKLIIFTQYRDTASLIKKRLAPITSSEIFVGQAKKGGTGLSQKKQKELLDKFREDEFSTLIATSVAEEGLDIPSVDAVIFYEPVPSAIRTVQRRGRTGRHSKGEVYVLVAKGTRDEGYRWSAHHKEKRMYRNLKKIKAGFKPSAPVTKNQKTLGEFKENDLSKIIVDYREKGSAVMKSLLAQSATLDLQQLSVGDYHVGDTVIEFKTVKDFVDSIIDGRLLSQLPELRSQFKPLIIVQGSEDLYSQRKINPQSIQGMLATILLNFQIPLLRTTSAAETAGIILAIAKRYANKEQRSAVLHTAKPWSLKAQQEYLIGSLPGIGPKLAKPLLKHFGSVIAIFTASIDELQKVDLVGPKKAQKIREILDSSYH